jgi:hypothetical protein
MGSRTVTVDVDVNVDIEDFDTDDLIDELDNRGYSVVKRDRFRSATTDVEFEGDSHEILFAIRQAYIIDNNDQFRKSLVSILAKYGYYV